MAYCVNFEQLNDDGSYVTPLQRLFVELWINLLESKTWMLLGPLPFSCLSLLEALKHAIVDEKLYARTIAAQVHVASTLLSQNAWIRDTYPYWDALQSQLAAACSNHATERDARVEQKTLVTELDRFLLHYKTSRVASHLSYIVRNDTADFRIVAREITDLVSDLIALGHSETFLYGWGRAVLLGRDPTIRKKSLASRLERFHELGRSRQYVVGFKVANPTGATIPTTNNIVVGRKVLDSFMALPELDCLPGETSVRIPIRALDYKAAVKSAMAKFEVHLKTLRDVVETSNVKVKEIIIKDLVCGEEMTVSIETLRFYEPHKLLRGASIWRGKEQLTEMAAISRILTWLASARNLKGEQQFLILWIVLMLLFGSENSKAVAAPLARYQFLIKTQLLAVWIADYVSKVFQRERATLSGILARKLGIGKNFGERPRAVIQGLRTEGLYAPFTSQSPLLSLRIGELRRMCFPKTRNLELVQMEQEARTWLPWVRGTRHSVAHLGSSSMESLELANHHLAETIGLVLDQAMATLARSPKKKLREVHHDTCEEFDYLMDEVINEPCVSVLHVREGRGCRAPMPRKLWQIH